MRSFITSHEWQEHYRANSAQQLPIPWYMGAGLSAAEARAVIASLQA